MRKLLYGTFMAGLVLLGLLAQTGAYLFGLPAPVEGAGEAGAEIAAFAERGLHAVGVRGMTIDDAPIPMIVWYPAREQAGSLTYAYAINMLGADSSIALATYQGQAVPGAIPDLSEGPYPLVVLSPGFAIRSESYAWLAEHLTSHGFVVVSPQHHESLDPSMLWQATIERPQDVLAVFAYIDEQVQAGGEFEGLIDNETVAVIGHSYGGYTALAAAGAQMDTDEFEDTCERARESGDPLVFLCDALVPRLGDMTDLAGLGSIPGGLWPAWADPRIDAVVAMAGDAAMFGQAGIAQVTAPLMAMGGTSDKDSPFTWGTQATYEYAASHRKVEIAFEGAEHLIFAGECDTVRRMLNYIPTSFCSDPAWDREYAHALVKHFTTAFLLAELEQDVNAAATLAGDGVDFSGVTYEAQGYQTKHIWRQQVAR
jgi:predicted dienelactone hydrolase